MAPFQKHLFTWCVLLYLGLVVAAEDDISTPLNNFTISLYKQMAKTRLKEDENAVVSPFSMAAVLSMLHAGSRGETARQIKDGLQLTDWKDDNIYTEIGNTLREVKGKDNSYDLETVNQLYVEKKFQLKEEFKSILINNYQAAPQSVDFQSDSTRKQINQNVEDFTRKKITDLLPSDSLDEDTKFVLINALYFKGQWESKFNKSDNKVGPFYLGSKDKKINVNMMRQSAKYFSGAIPSLDAKFLEMPYVGREVSMFIIVPDEMDGLATLEANLTQEILEEMEKKKKGPFERPVEIPKFKLQFEIEMKEQLKAFGMKDIFSATESDFSGVTDSYKGLEVSQVFHKTFLEVNEEGTEAAAATAAVAIQRASPTSFKVNRPSLWLLRHNPTGIWLFISRLVKPDEVQDEFELSPRNLPHPTSDDITSSSSVLTKSIFLLLLILIH